MTKPLTSFFSLPVRKPDLPVSQKTDTLRRRIQTLPRRTQQVFLLSRLDQRPYGEIAQLMEVDIDTVERCMVRLLNHCGDPASTEPSLLATREQAHQWYVHLQSPLATASQRIEFRHWLDADALHLQAFETSERLWRSLQAPSSIIGASGWHRRKRRVYVGWLIMTAFVCSLLVAAEVFS
jgi:hypothetical protein